MKIAVEGCAHGELDKIYESLEFLEKKHAITVDLLLICGDFQAVRNRADLRCMAVPPKFQKLNTFYKYYSGEKKAPILTIFIGGNHEASNYLSELPYGGWVCENIFYMGYANIINVNGIRIGGLSGIYKGQDYLKGHYEILPYDESSKRSAYHIRNVDVFRLKQIKKDIDIFMTHDWPRGVYNYGNKEQLLRFKPFFRNEMAENKLGSRPAEELLFKLCPSYWFSAHLHCQFAALVPHTKNDKDVCTKFLALDKCLPRRRFLQVLDIGAECSKDAIRLEYDSEWLAILQSTNHLLNISKSQTYMPGPGCSERWNFNPTDEELEKICDLFSNDFAIPTMFERIAPPEGSSKGGPEVHLNPQTKELCKILSVDYPLELLLQSSPARFKIKEYSIPEELEVTNVSQPSFDSSLTDSSLNVDDSNVQSSELGTTGSSGFFYIDTRKTDNSKTIPVGHELSFDERYALFGKDLEPESTSQSINLENFPEIKKRNLDDEDEDCIKPNVVNIKRRNQNVYTSVSD